jgi:hypothetical protein
VEKDIAEAVKKAIQESGEWRLPPEPPPRPLPKWKEWLAPGIILIVVTMGLSGVSSYVGRLKADDETQQQIKAHAIELLSLEDKAEANRQRFERCGQKDDYNRDTERATKQLDRISDNVDKLKK